MTKNAGSDKYKYSENGTGFDSLGSFASSDGSGFGKNVTIFGADMSSSIHIANKNKSILILGKSPADGLDDTTFAAKKGYSINFTKFFFKFAF